MSDSFVAFSYHFATDFEFVRLLAAGLREQGVSAWYLDRLIKPDNVSPEQYHGGQFDWRMEPQNWHATYLEQLCRASGIAVVLSESATGSRHTVGRGMWRERAAIEYFLDDNPVRIREIVRTAECPAAEAVTELASWARSILSLPPVLRTAIDDPNAFNQPTGLGPGIPIQLPETKSAATEWYELVRCDLYDVQWHCRRCGLQSYPYIMAQENPPKRCPRCGFESMSYNSGDREELIEPTEREKEFLAKAPDILDKIKALYLSRLQKPSKTDDA